jgi:hypothetical protein
LSFFFIAESQSDIWYVDSGASEHMTDRREWFDTFQPIKPGHYAVQIANNSQIWVQSRGNIKIDTVIDGSIIEDV